MREERAERGDETGPLFRQFLDLPGRDAKRQGAVGLADGDLRPVIRRSILSLQGDDMAAGVEHRDRQGLEAEVLALGEGGGNQNIGLFPNEIRLMRVSDGESAARGRTQFLGKKGKPLSPAGHKQGPKL